jgi:hypothetical protein
MTITLAKHEAVIKEDDLSIDVFNNYNKCFGCAVIPVNLLISGSIQRREI